MHCNALKYLLSLLSVLVFTSLAGIGALHKLISRSMMTSLTDNALSVRLLIMHLLHPAVYPQKARTMYNCMPTMSLAAPYHCGVAEGKGKTQ